MIGIFIARRYPSHKMLMAQTGNLIERESVIKTKLLLQEPNRKQNTNFMGYNKLE